jgi:hypothetical protein
MAFFPFVDMIVAAKLLIVIVWFGAGFSKCNRHFPNVLGPMVSNVPWLPSKAIKRVHYANFPEDLRPSELPNRLAHGPGMFGELVPPLVLLFSHNHTVTLLAAVFMIGYHLFIISTFPLAVPLEWNVLFMYLTAFLFLGYPAQHGYGLGDMSTPLLVATTAGLLLFPVLGNLRPDLVSFLPSMRAIRRQLGVGDMGIRSGCRAEARRAHRQVSADAEEPAAGQRSAAGLRRARRGDPAQHASGMAVDAQPGPRAQLRHDAPPGSGH